MNRVLDMNRDVMSSVFQATSELVSALRRSASLLYAIYVHGLSSVELSRTKLP